MTIRNMLNNDYRLLGEPFEEYFEWQWVFIDTQTNRISAPGDYYTQVEFDSIRWSTRFWLPVKIEETKRLRQ